MNPTPQNVHCISECFIKPHSTPEESKQPYYLSPWDLLMLSVQYIQKGLLYAKPPTALDDGGQFIDSLLKKLKHSLSIALVHFYPLAGRLATIRYEDEGSCLVYVDCNNSPGAKFIHARLDMTISDILSPTDVPVIVQSLFDHDRAVNHDGHSRSLLSVQVTELLDGVFIGCSINHSIVDGSSYWHFFNMWSEIFQAEDGTFSISRPPILPRWFPEGHGPILKLPFTNPDQFITKFEAPQLRERMFHFSSESLAILKVRANTEYKTNKISSFQSLSALVWRSITRARGLSPDQTTGCRLAINNRSRLNPPLPENYFGNSIQTVRGVAIVKELLENNLGWAAWKLHEAVVNHDDEKVRDHVNKWLESPFVYQIAQLFDPLSVMMGSSPRFNKYGNVFGMGKALALRSGYAHKFDGKVSCYPGSQGGGSIDLELCLRPDFMSVLEADEEFMNATTPPDPLYS
ncbi:protein ENHANCED PSEUDOMONAS SUSCEPTIBILITY 1-like [Benincasa hispida]|uniref:protein ENHANCED PSEUDOMONAS SUSCEPTIBILITY 1-like n=1 Tax=Benincasa hispida TaxID=102211 RepID=UPI001900199D|nr:protein ENHANCED PSEUDOMONAS SUSCEPTIBILITY 1-like [Benincasa hispida]